LVFGDEHNVAELVWANVGEARIAFNPLAMLAVAKVLKALPESREVSPPNLIVLGEPMSKPMRRTRSLCCARDDRPHRHCATKSVMNSRRVPSSLGLKTSILAGGRAGRDHALLTSSGMVCGTSATCLDGGPQFSSRRNSGPPVDTASSTSLTLVGHARGRVKPRSYFIDTR